ncbi:YbfB/YjiJ family MFS transporter [Sinorhizobium meliloti]|uniref:YbfB/YjiJ family MFS transporter n=1 Tax=Rhizobium meliloti TaxID=382 RepID=UPI000FD3166E|nr:YbfB/YjiJ family MFS transporter [Sinorhizobium meliloti]MDW9428495.1 YbfB/YjiJ family MFS transporter [Sinorhizobium meliloti]MDW9535868.1 YbfB/YjiJ family MFS transporter [Sinorhizobium meliloti]MDW9667620.1 YbfB/YjiJ family MFS transporter [Sinorhizobium meliloti]MQV11722.1 YbfB/YjiJ family MFS transporter [Sinorhizobium meliloti]MQV32815.1 YbfB/YjiJ family MFS transporter [Sinorhizobium meliloti]
MSQHARRQLTVVLAGAASLAIAMGVGRFAFTPILPMMLHDGVLDLQVAGNLATANYIGYLVGALASMLVPKKWDHTTVIRLALVTTVILTALMALPVPSMWISLRFLAGVVSAVGFVFTSGWCLAELSGTSGSIGSAIYTGPGAGIALSGVAASFMSAAGLTGQLGWVTFAAMSAIMSALIWGVFGRRTKLVEPFYVGTARAASGKVLGAEMPLFAMAYGLAGFGYIITATYLPVIAKNAIPDSPLLTVFWPLFGISAVVGSLLAAKVKKSADARLYLIGSYLLQAAGVALSVVWQDALGLAASSMLVGIPFTAISFFAMNEVRRIRSTHHARHMGLLTAMFAIGQIMGPPAVGAILRHEANVDVAFALALGIASIALVVGAAIFVAMIVVFPAERRQAGTAKHVSGY